MPFAVASLFAAIGGSGSLVYTEVESGPLRGRAYGWRVAGAKPYFGLAASTTLSPSSTGAHDPARMPSRSQETREVRPRPDVAGLAGVDRADWHPRDRQVEGDAPGDHLDLEGEAVLGAVEELGHQSRPDQPVPGLAVEDRLAHRGRDEETADGVREPADRRHLPEVRLPTISSGLSASKAARNDGISAGSC